MKVNAYLTDYDLRYLNPEDLNSEKVLDKINISRSDMSSQGWIKVGEAEVDLSLLPTDTVVGNAVKALRVKQEMLRAAATAECTRLEGRIQQLMCLENKSTVHGPLVRYGDVVTLNDRGLQIIFGKNWQQNLHLKEVQAIVQEVDPKPVPTHEGPSYMVYTERKDWEGMTIFDWCFDKV